MVGSPRPGQLLLLRTEAAVCSDPVILFLHCGPDGIQEESLLAFSVLPSLLFLPGGVGGCLKVHGDTLPNTGLSFMGRDLGDSGAVSRGLEGIRGSVW